MRVSKEGLSALFLVFPRSVFSYPFYGLASILIYDYKRSALKSYFFVVAFLAFATLSYFVNSLFLRVSLVSFFLELIFLFPLVMFCAGFRVSVSERVAIQLIRFIGAVCFFLSLLNLIKNGFPLKLPYVHYLPDEYFGPYGIGGARIITVVGFFALLMEFFFAPKYKVSSRFFLFVAISNFLIPSYIIGIMAGLAGMAIIYIRRPMVAALGLIIIFPTVYYAFGRLDSVNTMVGDHFGHHPKVLAYINVISIFYDYPYQVLFGTGVGQFTSVPQGWASDAIRHISIQEVPRIPGLYSSAVYVEYIEPINRLAFDNIYAISSSFNKPYSGFSTLFSELGAFSIIIVALLFKRIWGVAKQCAPGMAIFVFFILINLIDSWADNFWMSYLLALTVGSIEKGNQECS